MFSNPESNVTQLGLLPGSHVADLGAGSGFYTIPLAKAVGPKGRVYAVDIQKDLLAKIKSIANTSRIYNIDIICGDLEKMGGTRLREGMIDCALAANILFQLPDKKTFIREVKRVLKSNGRAVVIDWSDSFGGIGPQASDVLTSFQAKQLFEAEGFMLDRTLSAGDHHYGLIFKKS